MSKIYTLVSLEKYGESFQYVHAISHSREILEDMVENIHPYDLEVADFFIEENASVYYLTKINGKIFLTRSLSKVSFNKDNLYAFNKITTDNVENCILDISGFEIEELNPSIIFKDNISENKIKLDTYYEEGIMNA